jgi:Protein of unknown function (DUF3429)
MNLPLKQAAWILTLGGLIPFVGLAAISAWMPAYAELAFRALIAYGMVILSFVGAIHWGAVFNKANYHGGWPLVWGVIPSLWAWVTGVYPPHLQPLWLVAGLLLALGVDMVVYRRYGFPVWVLSMRWVATIGASLSLAALAFNERLI